MAMQVKHTFVLYLCPRCRRRRVLAKPVSGWATVVCIVLLFVSIIAGVLTESWLVFLLVIAVTVVVAIAAGKYDETTWPKYPVYTKKEVEIEIPGKGRFTLFGNHGARTS
jgi:cell division protein FtsW (lipid II flippase)